jgi:hypothetical protein
MNAKLGIAVAVMTLVLGAPPLAGAGLPSDVVLPNAAPYVRVMPGCVWGIGARSLTVTRRVGQAINIVNLDTRRHRFTGPVGSVGSAGPMPSWLVGRHQALSFIWRVPTTVILTTCDRRLRLVVHVRVD